MSWTVLQNIALQVLLAIASPLLVLAVDDPANGTDRHGESPVGPQESVWAALAIGGHGRFDFYTADKKLDGLHNLHGLTLQPKSMPRFGSWGDAKIEGRFTDEDLRRTGGPQARLLEAYVNLYSSSVDVRIGKQIIAWGRADGLNPTDNLTPKDFTVLSAKDEEERRTGTTGILTKYHYESYTLSVAWLPLFNPNTIPIARVAGIQVSEDKSNAGAWNDQGVAIRFEQTREAFDWSLSYYNGLDINPAGIPLSSSVVKLVHTRIRVLGADFAMPAGPYGLRGEIAYVQTANPSGENPFIKKPYVWMVLGGDRNLTEDLNLNLQIYQRFILNYRDPFAIEESATQQLSVLDAVINQQLDQSQVGLNGRIKASWFNKTLEAELMGVWNANRGDLFLRPSLTYAFTDVWKGMMGYDFFNGQRDSYFGRLEPASAFYLELRATF